MRRTAGKTPSSTVAISAAMLFVAVASVLSFVAEDRVGAGWSLRGTLVPSAEARPAH